MVSFMDLLPVETVNHIVQYLGTGDANRFGQTCKGAYSITNPIVYKDNVPAKTKRGPVTWGVVTRQLRVIEMAVAAGADISASDWLCCFHYELGLTGRFHDREEWWWGDEAIMEGKGSPLHYAAMINNVEAAEYLLQKSTTKDVWSMAMCPCEGRWDYEYERTIYYVPLHTAACHGNLDVTRILMEHGASAASGYISDTDLALLHTLAGKGPNRLAMIEFIARHPGVDINETDGNGQIPLEVAISKPNNGDIIVKLVQLGAKDSDQFDSNYNFVQYCITNRHLENALALLEADVYGHDHIRPIVDDLFCAVVDPQAVWENYNRVLDMSEELIKRIVHIMIEKYGLDINTPLGDSGHTPLNFIIHLGNQTKLNFIATLLINLGARLDVADQLGHNALVACLWAKSKSGKDDEMRQAYHGIMPLLIKASWHQDIDMNAKYTWNGKRQALFKILRHQFPEWRHAKGLPNKVLWRSLYASTFNEDNPTAAAYFSERIQVSIP